MSVEVTRAEARRLLSATPFGSGEKLRIEGGIIHYRLYQQDGTLEPMTCADTKENRMFVEWVQMRDRYTGKGAQ